MNTLIIGLVYGNRPYHLINEAAGSKNWQAVNTEGIANALNDGIDLMKAGNYDSVVFLANDIQMPQGWLQAMQEAVQTYPSAGIVAIPLEQPVTEYSNQLIISNWLITKDTIDRVGYFNESMFPYGPIDLDYCERCHAAGINTYYVVGPVAHHIGYHATGNEYGWDKGQLVAQNEQYRYKNGQEIYKQRLKY
jgi:GT2 family glycosyltransferase